MSLIEAISNQDSWNEEYEQEFANSVFASVIPAFVSDIQQKRKKALNTGESLLFEYQMQKKMVRYLGAL